MLSITTLTEEPPNRKDAIPLQLLGMPTPHPSAQHSFPLNTAWPSIVHPITVDKPAIITLDDEIQKFNFQSDSSNVMSSLNLSSPTRVHPLEFFLTKHINWQSARRFFFDYRKKVQSCLVSYPS
jgi:hypothetical protein